MKYTLPMFRLLLTTLLLGFLPFGAGAYDVLIEGYEPVGTKDGYPLYEVAEKAIKISSAGGNFYIIYIDGKEDFRFSYPVVSTNLWTSEIMDGDIHELKLDNGNDVYSVAYITRAKSVTDEGVIYGKINGMAFAIGFEDGIKNAVVKPSILIGETEMSVTGIGCEAFRECFTLQDVEMPSSLKVIGERAFLACSSLEEIVLPDNVITIGERAFEKCSLLKGIEIPSLVEIIEGGTFLECSSLAFVKFPDTLKRIDGWAFSGCRSLTFDKLPEALKVIGERAFLGCSLLKSIVIPASVERISHDAFSACIGLKTVEFGSGLKDVSSSAFNGCDLTKVFWLSPTPPEDANSVKAQMIYVPNDSYRKTVPSGKVYPSLTSLFKVDGLTYIPVDENTCVVADCEYGPEPAGYIVPEKVVDGDKEMTVGDVCDYAFYGNGNMTAVTLSNTGNIGSYAFAGCGNLASAVIGSSGEIGKYAFSGNVKLADVTFGEGLKRIRTSAFEGCSSIREVRIPESVELISSSAFKDCTGLSAVKLGSGIMEISHDTFAGCSSLASVKIPDGVKFIGKRSFSGCSSLAEVTAGKGVENIGEEAFAGCAALENYYSYSLVPPVCAANAFDGIDKTKCALYVPKESMESYKEADQWKEFLLVSALPDVNVADIDVSEAVGVSRTEEGCVLRNVENESVVVYTLEGGLMFKTDRYEGEEIRLEPGVYVLKAGSNAVKIRL